jgi:hypothetical protein
MGNALDKNIEEHLRNGKVVQAPTQGASMRPFIQGGRDKVLVCRKEEIGIGDIVMVPYRGILILHRVYAIEGTKLVLMGDGNLKGNEVVDKSDVWGTAIEIIKPNGRRRKPNKAWIWRHTLPFRKIMLKVCRKWYRIRGLNLE